MNHDEDDRKDESTGSDCTFPRDVPFEELQRHVPYDQSLEQDALREYVEIESSGETVLFLEKIKSEKFRDREIDVWNVRTDQNRYWICKNPTNLYLQESFPSIDFLMSFHIGLIERVMARHTPPVTDEQQQRFSGAWRRWSQATEAFDLADEAEDFQSVGMRCRECLLEFVRSMSDVSMVAEGRSAPKRGDFIHWAELVADEIATGSSASEVRGYLKSVSRSTWQLVGWLTHAKRLSQNGMNRA